MLVALRQPEVSNIWQWQVKCFLLCSYLFFHYYVENLQYAWSYMYLFIAIIRFILYSCTYRYSFFLSGTCFSFLRLFYCSLSISLLLFAGFPFHILDRIFLLWFDSFQIFQCLPFILINHSGSGCFHRFLCRFYVYPLLCAFLSLMVQFRKVSVKWCRRMALFLRWQILFNDNNNNNILQIFQQEYNKSTTRVQL